MYIHIHVYTYEYIYIGSKDTSPNIDSNIDRKKPIFSRFLKKNEEKNIKPGMYKCAEILMYKYLYVCV
jgi:hypothetical protein